MTKGSVRTDKQQLKKDRIKDYFLNAAKEIIMQEGVENISVRNVADRAGYSYATLYNYFEDLNDLLWHAKLIIIKDVFDWMQDTVADFSKNLEGLKKTYHVYMSYFFDHPNVFVFLFNYHVTAPKNQIGTYNLDFDSAMRETFKGIVLETKLREEDVPVVYKLHVYVVHGLLTLYFSGSPGMTPQLAAEEIDSIINYIFNKEGV